MTSPDKARITLRLPKEMDDALAAKSNKAGVSKNALILIAVGRWLEDQSNLFTRVVKGEG